MSARTPIASATGRIRLRSHNNLARRGGFARDVDEETVLTVKHALVLGMSNWRLHDPHQQSIGGGISMSYYILKWLLRRHLEDHRKSRMVHDCLFCYLKPSTIDEIGEIL